MAGAGYKLFNTGDVLTAAQVNTYLMEQTVMVFANAAARTTALSGVVSEGMISYLKDTNAVEVYDGTNWVSSDDPNAIQNTIVDAKGDLISASAADVPARLAVGSNYEVLSAQSGESTGLKWVGNVTSYTPTWTADGGSPSIGNGQLAGYWQRYGKLCNVRLFLQVGSTTTKGTGSWYFSLPFAPAVGTTAGISGNAYIEDFAVAGYRAMAGLASDGRFYFVGGTFTPAGNVGATNPFTMNTNDYIAGQLIYEVA